MRVCWSRNSSHCKRQLWRLLLVHILVIISDKFLTTRHTITSLAIVSVGKLRVAAPPPTLPQLDPEIRVNVTSLINAVGVGVTPWQAGRLLVGLSMCDAVLQHTVAYSGKLFSFAKKGCQCSNFQQEKIDVQFSLRVLRPAPLGPVGRLPSPKLPRICFLYPGAANVNNQELRYLSCRNVNNRVVRW